MSMFGFDRPELYLGRYVKLSQILSANTLSVVVFLNDFTVQLHFHLFFKPLIPFHSSSSGKAVS